MLPAPSLKTDYILVFEQTGRINNSDMLAGNSKRIYKAIANIMLDNYA
jgi:hypothetical protein